MLIATLFSEEISADCSEYWAYFVAYEIALCYPHLLVDAIFDMTDDVLTELLELIGKFVAPSGGLDALVQIFMHWCPDELMAYRILEEQSIAGTMSLSFYTTIRANRTFSKSLAQAEKRIIGASTEDEANDRGQAATTQSYCTTSEAPGPSIHVYIRPGISLDLVSKEHIPASIVRLFSP